MNDTPSEPLHNTQWEPPDTSFHHLPLKRKVLAMPITQAYAVHLPNGERKFVRAESALAALREANLEIAPLRIERLGTDHFNVYYPVGLKTNNPTPSVNE